MSLPISVRDLAPGDGKSADLDLARFEFTRIRSVGDPLFDFAYARLWDEFGGKDEMELRETLDQRFQRTDIRYEMWLVREAGEFVAVRDHTAILARGGADTIVHLSHLLIAPSARRSGLGGWLRALPIDAARNLQAAQRTDAAGAQITLVAEMEYSSDEDASRFVRLLAYERAGFSKIDPARVRYHQPDFRAPSAIDAAGGASPLPFQLVVRRVGREQESVITSGEARELVEALYAIYRPQCRPCDLAHPSLLLDFCVDDEAPIPLVPPTAC